MHSVTSWQPESDNCSCVGRLQTRTSILKYLSPQPNLATTTQNRMLNNASSVSIATCRPTLYFSRILEWADSFHKYIGRWPTRHDGKTACAPGEAWSAVASALWKEIGGYQNDTHPRFAIAESANVFVRLDFVEESAKRFELPRVIYSESNPYSVHRKSRFRPCHYELKSVRAVGTNAKRGSENSHPLRHHERLAIFAGQICVCLFRAFAREMLGDWVHRQRFA